LQLKVKLCLGDIQKQIHVKPVTVEIKIYHPAAIMKNISVQNVKGKRVYFIDLIQ
jgi:hypothetical protein